MSKQPSYELILCGDCLRKSLKKTAARLGMTERRLAWAEALLRRWHTDAEGVGDTSTLAKDTRYFLEAQR